MTIPQGNLFPAKNRNTGRARRLMHPNSIKSWREMDIGDRMKQIAGAFEEHGPMTDRQVKNKLGFEDMNSVRPSICSLLDLDIIDECDRVKCPTSNRTVRVCRIKQRG